MYIRYHVILIIIFGIFCKAISIDLKKKLEKNEKICLFHRQLAYIYLLLLMQGDLAVVFGF